MYIIKFIQFTIILTLVFSNALMGQGSILSNSEKEVEVFKVVEQMPRFPGCEDLRTEAEKKTCADAKMLEYIYSNLIMPQEAINNKVNGQVVLQFMIEIDGLISEIKIAREVGYGCGQAAVDVIESMNKLGKTWRPGHQRGRPVKVLYTLPIKFDTQKEYKSKEE